VPKDPSEEKQAKVREHKDDSKARAVLRKKGRSDKKNSRKIDF
jgi:hypothetical protein